eukprot:Em0018g86a
MSLHFQTTLQFLNLYWNMNSRPTLCLFLTESRLKGPGFYSFVNFLSLLKQGEVNGIRVRLDRLQALISTSCVENLECSQLDNSLEQKLLSPLRPRSSTARLSVVAATGVEDGRLFRMRSGDGGVEFVYVEVELGRVEVELRGMEVELVEVELGGVEVEFVWVEVELGGVELGGVEVELRGMEVELVEVELGGVEVEFVWVEVELGGVELGGVEVELRGMEVELVEVELGGVELGRVEVELRGMEVELVEVELGGVEVEFVWVEVELGGVELGGVEVELRGMEVELVEVELGGVEDIRDYSVRELQSALQKEENLLGQAYLLYELMKKGEQFVRGVPIKEKLEDIYAVAGMHKHWMTLRQSPAFCPRL